MEFAMPFDGNGNHSLPPGTIVQEGQTVLPSQHNPPFLDVSASLSQTLLRSGAAPWTGDQNANGNKLTNLAAPTNPNDALRLTDLSSRPAFLANKNGVNQNAIVGSVKITFPNEVFDQGGYYDAASSKWTPPAGKYRVTAAFSVKISGGAATTIEIRKGGVGIARGFFQTTGGLTNHPTATILFETDGTQDIEVYAVQVDGTFSGNILGLITDTYFCGEAI